MFEVKAIQADYGDALLVSYGAEANPEHLLIDGGPAGTLVNLEKVLKQCRNSEGALILNALVITHYDRDHIQGIVELLENKPNWLQINDIWFNGRHHLLAPDQLGSSEGDALTKLIISGKYNWNRAFAKGAIHQHSPLPCPPSGLAVYVLSPNLAGLKALADDWSANAPPSYEYAPSDRLGRDDDWPPGNFDELISNDRFKRDDAVPNGSSIALLLVHEGRKLLLAADAHADVVKTGIRHHFGGKITVDLLKVSHHGSSRNTDKILLESLQCRRFLISTSGKSYKHPDNILMARLVATGGSSEIHFNYDVPHTNRWRTMPMNWPAFQTFYPSATDLFIRVEV